MVTEVFDHRLSFLTKGGKSAFLPCPVQSIKPATGGSEPQNSCPKLHGIWITTGNAAIPLARSCLLGQVFAAQVLCRLGARSWQESREGGVVKTRLLSIATALEELADSCSPTPCGGGEPLL